MQINVIKYYFLKEKLCVPFRMSPKQTPKHLFKIKGILSIWQNVHVRYEQKFMSFTIVKPLLIKLYEIKDLLSLGKFCIGIQS